MNGDMSDHELNAASNEEIGSAFLRAILALAKERGISRDELVHVLASPPDDTFHRYCSRYEEVLREQMKCSNVTDSELAAQVGLPVEVISNAATEMYKQPASIALYRIPIALGIEPVDFAERLTIEGEPW